MNRKNYPPRTRFRCRNCTCNCGRRDNFFVKKLSLIWREENMHAWTKQCRNSDENAHFFLLSSKSFYLFVYYYFFFCRSRLVSKTHQRLFIHSFLLEISRKRLLLQDWAIKFWLALLLSPESFFFLRSRLVSKIHQHWFIHAFLLETFEKATLR